ncbi:hypothetical protein CCM_09445 [Cordyceps militaris CM01]|uniref:Uncharacterized protein n=1 Tax=Cordyceps militaris (strain CM01) TaxID=983644 RepID=G3JUB6_CORMM|nr:uncharacterized protein CCM_09445 [Cordyceps militaris CM01]EGX87823.1 hypothetical protein CCM_09445 [Cordyceps militaris CM01]
MFGAHAVPRRLRRCHLEDGVANEQTRGSYGYSGQDRRRPGWFAALLRRHQQPNDQSPPRALRHPGLSRTFSILDSHTSNVSVTLTIANCVNDLSCLSYAVGLPASQPKKKPMMLFLGGSRNRRANVDLQAHTHTTTRQQSIGAEPGCASQNQRHWWATLLFLKHRLAAPKPLSISQNVAREGEESCDLYPLFPSGIRVDAPLQEKKVGAEWLVNELFRCLACHESDTCDSNLNVMMNLALEKIFLCCTLRVTQASPFIYMHLCHPLDATAKSPIACPGKCSPVLAGFRGIVGRKKGTRRFGPSAIYSAVWI